MKKGICEGRGPRGPRPFFWFYSAVWLRLLENERVEADFQKRAKAMPQRHVCHSRDDERLYFNLPKHWINIVNKDDVLYNGVCTYDDSEKGKKPMANMDIRYEQHTISSAFKNHYIVPDYQREYVWKDEQVEQLLADLLDAYNSDNLKPYFLGTIVTYDSGSQFELIDGQQRLTTFFIMLCAIKKIYAAHREQTSFIENMIYSPTMNSEGDVINQHHLQLQYEDAENCLELIEKDAEQPNTVTQSGERLFDAYRMIQDFLCEHFPEIPALKKFVVFVLYKTTFIRIQTSDISDALKIFETINQRGKGLDSMDLLKNMVFRQVDRSKFKELNMKWKSITDLLEKIDEKPLRFLRYFIMANYDTYNGKDGILREDQIYTWLSNNNAQCRYEEAPFQFVRKMLQNVDLYVKCRKPDDTSEGNVHLKNIPLLAGKSYKLHLMLLLAASNMKPDAFAHFKAILESVVYYTVIDRIATNVTERTFVLWCRDVRNIITKEELDCFVRNTIIPTVNGWKQDNRSNFLRLGLNSMQQYRIKFILGKITAYVDTLRLGRTTVGDLTVYTQTAVDIEHIMPQSCTDKGRYGMNEDEFAIYVNRLGNLTLLENSINKSIQNGAYANKSVSYKQSKFYITSSISGLVNQGQNTAINRTNLLLSSWSDWNRQSIEERQEMLYRLSEMIWGLR